MTAEATASTTAQPAGQKPNKQTTTFRIGQFQKHVELRSGENLLVFRVQSQRVAPELSALLVGPRNDGDTVEGIRWMG